MGVSITGGASRNRENENEDPSEGNSSNEGHNQRMRPTTSWLSDADQAGQHLAKPALSGRKARRKTCPEDKQGRRGDRNQERDEERRFRGKDKGQELSRRMETVCADQVQDEPMRGTSECFSSSNSEMQLKTIFEAGEPSNHSERQHKSLRSQAVSFTQTTTTNLKSQSGRPAVQSRFTHPSSQDPLSRDLYPFWAEVRTERPSQYPLSQTQISVSEDEEEEDENKEAIEEGCGVIEVTGRAMYSTETPPCMASGERRMSKREKNRIESLRRRRREKWRPSQQPESTQVNLTVVTVIIPLLLNVLTVSSYVYALNKSKKQLFNSNEFLFYWYPFDVRFIQHN